MSDWSSCVVRICRTSTKSLAIERWGSETELAAATCSCLSLVAAGSFVRSEPELVPVEGVVTPALGGVKPETDIETVASVRTVARLLGGIPTATPDQLWRYG